MNTCQSLLGGLSKTEVLTGYIHTADGIKPAEEFENFECYVTNEYAEDAKKIIERAERRREEEAT